MSFHRGADRFGESLVVIKILPKPAINGYPLIPIRHCLPLSFMSSKDGRETIVEWLDYIPEG